MKTLIKIDMPRCSGHRGIGASGKYQLTLPESPEGYTELGAALAEAAGKNLYLRNAVMNAAASIIAAAFEPAWLLERLSLNVRDKVRLQEESQNEK